MASRASLGYAFIEQKWRKIIMRALTAELYNPENEMSTRIILPASYEEMQDALQRIKGNAHDCVADIQNFLDGIEPLGNKTLQSCSLYELNHFATLYQNI